ncbi:MAG TPA: methyltransferase domain-containing protein [Thermoanaerobaculia bacterium]
MRFDPEEWARVHDAREDRHLAFRRGLELCVEACAERIHPGELWADVGAGTGHLAGALAALGARVIGLDRDPRMARYSRGRWPRAVAFAVADASHLALADASCGGIVAISLLGCLASPAGFFAEAARALSPGGTLCVSAMNRRSLLLAVSKASSWRRRPSGAPRYTAYDPADLAGALRRAGLVPERQILYAHFVAAGSRIVPGAAAARRRERTVPPGTRDSWARQLLILARRAGQ